MNISICPKCFQHNILGGVCPGCGFVPEAEEPMPLALPYYSQLNNRYLTGKVLGIGGFGITYTAYDGKDKRLCCIKEYCPTEYVAGRDSEHRLLCRKEDLREEYEDGKEHFLAEAEILGELRSNITVVDAWDCFEQNETVYYVMELLKGENLHEYRKNHDIVNVKAIALQMLLTIGKALGSIHRYGLLHGDVSPENIIITEKGDIKLIDFGTARAITKSVQSKSGKIYLKPSYAPPELYSTQALQGPWSDVYSLAATYYAVVSGCKLIDAGRRKNGEDYKHLNQMNLGISDQLSAVIDQALVMDYHGRYQSMVDFVQGVSSVITESDLQVVDQEGANETQVLSKDVYKEMKDKDEEVVKKSSWRFWGRKKKSFQYLELWEKGKVVRRWMVQPDRLLTIGRHPESDIMTPSNSMISRRHCKLYFNSRQEKFILQDAGSKYGTFLENGEKLYPEKEYELRAGENFYICTPRFTFKVVIEQ